MIYVIVLFGVAAAHQYWGNAGLYLIAVISGLTDVDAITLSTADLVKSGSVEAATGWRVILIAVLATLVLKAGMVASTGGRALLLRILPVYGAALLTGLAILFLWP